MRFVFVDEILALQPGRGIHARHTWPGDLELFQDHFPGFKVVPGVLLTEMMGQTAAICIESAPKLTGKPMLAQIKNATFRHWVLPDQLLDVHAEVKTLRPSFALISARTEHAGKVVAETELLFSFAPAAQFGEVRSNPALTRYLAGQAAGQGTPASGESP